MEKVYEYKNVYRTKNGEIKEYTKKIKHVIGKEKKVTDKDLLNLIKEINDNEKRKRIKQLIENIKNE